MKEKLKTLKVNLGLKKGPWNLMLNRSLQVPGQMSALWFPPRIVLTTLKHEKGHYIPICIRVQNPFRSLPLSLSLHIYFLYVYILIISLYKNQTKEYQGRRVVKMVITGHFQPRLLTWKDWCRGTIQDFHGQAEVVGSNLPDALFYIDLSSIVLNNKRSIYQRVKTLK